MKNSCLLESPKILKKKEIKHSILNKLNKKVDQTIQTKG